MSSLFKNIPDLEKIAFQTNTTDVYLNQLFSFYHGQLMDSDALCSLLESKGVNRSIIEQNWIGYCNRSLNTMIPPARTADGGGFRGTLQSLGLIKPTGHELFRGCIVEPIVDRNKRIVCACGIKLKCPSRPAPRVINWYRFHVYNSVLCFAIMSWGKRYAI